MRNWVPARVTAVIDGDTIDADPAGRVRIIGYNCPEQDEKGYETANGIAHDLLISYASRDIWLEPDL